MATAITTLSTTLEGQFLEICRALQTAEKDTSRNPNGTNTITYTYNSESKLTSGTFNLSCAETSAADSSTTISAVEYLTD